MSGVISAQGLRFRYAGAQSDAVAGVDLLVPDGGFCAVIGPNGCGKSTLLGLVLGRLRPDAGTVEFAGRQVEEWDRTDIARRVGAVAQNEEIAFPLRVRELVAMGRYPHLGAWRSERAIDSAAIEEAMARCHVLPFADRLMGTLSGGERQRARIARALAQQPDALVLDEPTASLDVRHEMDIFELLRELASVDRRTVLLVTHNINLAARYADRLLLLDRGSVAAEGAPEDVLRPDLLERVYHWPVAVGRHPGPGPDAGAPQLVPLSRHTGTSTTPSPSAMDPSPDGAQR